MIKWSFFILQIFLLNVYLYAEGTKEIMPTSTSHGMIQIFPSYSSFAYFEGDIDYRLNIHIKEVGEIIYFGFGRAMTPDYGGYMEMDDLFYRLLDPSGNVVIDWTNIYSSVKGRISTYNQAVIGPNALFAGGYNAMDYIAQKTGDYYIEFVVADPLTDTIKEPDTLFIRREIEFFDITVSTSNKQPINGRIWSKAWQFTTGIQGMFNYSFTGTVYVYSDDGIVTSLNLNGMKPLVFTMAANETGVDSTGNFIEDRKSRSDLNIQYINPQYKIFLNDPDSIVYPTGEMGIIITEPEIVGCFKEFNLNISTNKSGNVYILFDLNGIEGYQTGTRDVFKIINVKKGLNIFSWDGKDGFGNIIQSNEQVGIEVTYYSGLTNIPLNDVEQNPNGYIVRIVRPKVANNVPKLFWDDSKILGGVSELNGCDNTVGCHKWTCTFNNNEPINSLGNENTINTWWYASVTAKTTLHNFKYYYSIITDIEPAKCKQDNGKANLIILGDTNQLKFLWSTGATTKDIHNAKSGNYSVTITNSYGCDTILNVYIPLFETHFAHFVIDDIKSVSCNGGSDGSATINTTDTTLSFTYKWSNGETTNKAVNLKAGINYVTITDSNQCDTIINVEINEPDAMILNITSIEPKCFEDSTGSITTIASNGVEPYKYLWSNNDTTATISNLIAGIYVLTISDANGCQITQSITMQAPPELSVSVIIPSIFCIGDSISISANAKGGIFPYRYTWHNNQTNDKQNIIAENNQKIFIEVIDSNNCKAISDTILIYQDVLGNDITITGNNPKCEYDTISLTVNTTGGTNIELEYKWSDGTTSRFHTKEIYPSTNTTYYLTVTDNCNIVYDTVIINVVNKPIIDIPNYKGCVPLEISLSLDNSFDSLLNLQNILWDLGNGKTFSGNNINYTYTEAGAYDVILQINTNLANCYYNYVFNKYIEVFPYPLSDFDYRPLKIDMKNPEVTFFNNSIGANHYVWDFGDSTSLSDYSYLKDPKYSFTNAGNYNVSLIATNNHGCTDTSTKTLKVIQEYMFYAPKAFSPGDDGVNDMFQPIITELIEDSYNLYIYSRWGELIFHTTNIEEAWDGKYKARQVQSGIYIWMVKFKDAQNQSRTHIGHITVIN